MTTSTTLVAPSVGEERSLVVVDDLSRTRIVQYAGASGDYNPLHTDEVYARETAGYPGVFAHGMLTMGLTARVVTDWVGEERLAEYGVRFSKQVWPGDTLTATAKVESVEDGLVRFAVTTVNQKGEVVLTGHATARFGA